MSQSSFRCVLMILISMMLVGCASGPSPSDSDNKKPISSTTQTIPATKTVTSTQAKSAPAPKPEKIRVVIQPERRLEQVETEQFTKKVLSLLAPFQVSDITTADLGGAVTPDPGITGGVRMRSTDKIRDDGTWVTLTALVEREGVQPVSVTISQRTGDISSMSLGEYIRDTRKTLIWLSHPNTDSEQNHLRFNVVTIYEKDGDIEHVYTFTKGSWSYVVYEFDLLK